MDQTTQLAHREENAVAHGTDDKKVPSVTLAPAVDIVEDASGVTLWADLPGVSRDNLQVSFNDGTLHIDAEAAVPTPSGLRVQHVEVRHPHFARAFSLGPDLDATQIGAQLQDGVLKLSIPRREEARPRRIEVSAG
ncbi:Hsp20/alpha crystallin family protein [Cupriavidus plantarum]|uniref:Hsp20/alpha crystallin family protein n=1 Tax=Cupriavidus plantarum TaxID=942865 RepID=UPI00339D642E